MGQAIAYAVTAVVFLLVDGTWLALVAQPMFMKEVGALLRSEPNIAAALAFYLLYPVGLTALAVSPSTSFGGAALRGAILGLTAYATFDLTNLAVLNGWTVKIAIFDMAWGTFVSGLAAAVGFRFRRRD